MEKLQKRIGANLLSEIKIENHNLKSKIYFCAFMKKAFLQLHLAVMLAGFTAILGKLITLNEGYLTIYRMVLSALILWVIIYFRKELTTPFLEEYVDSFWHWGNYFFALGYLLRKYKVFECFSFSNLFVCHWIFYFFV